MLKHVKAKVEIIDPYRALALLESIDPTFQRKLAKSHVRHLARLIKTGQFTATGSVVLVGINGDWRCANGQHTLHAIVEAEQGVRVLYEEYTCSTDAEYVSLFHAFDTENRKRTFLDSAVDFLRCQPGSFAKASPTTLNLFRSGVEYFDMIINGKPASKRTRQERYELAADMVDEMNLFVELQGVKEYNETLDRSAVIACLIMTYQSDPVRARNFWMEVVSGNFKSDPDFNKNHPSRFLHNWLRTFNQKYNRGKASGTQMRYPIYKGCMKCYNAFVMGREIKILRVNTGELGIEDPATVEVADSELELV